MQVEKKRTELSVGDIIVAKKGGKRYEVTAINAGMKGRMFPYLTLKCDGEKAEHDTGWDSYSATYTVETNE